MFYTGKCRIIRQEETKGQKRFVLEQLSDGNGELAHQKSSGKGQLLVPRPGVLFNHPLVHKRIRLEVDELSHSWFSLVERYESAVLFPGLVLPQLEIEVAPGFSLYCRAQVSSAPPQEDFKEKTITWRLEILDMGVEDQGRLFSLLQRASHPSSYVYGKVDLDDLITFFFDSGFVYPKKFAALPPDRMRFMETYRRLYIDNPAIARHFIKADKGVMLGHLSMLRVYENTWMLHHHASIGQHAAGLGVLNQARDYVNDYRHLFSSHMDFLICYYRPDNKFPNSVFGGFARNLGNSRLCSTDSMAYFNFEFDTQAADFGVTGWKLEQVQDADLNELLDYYSYASAGLAMKALDLEPALKPESGISEEYTRLGFKRERHLFSLKKDGALKALFMALVSDACLNMSGLLHCVHVFAIDGDNLPPEVLYRHLALLAPLYEEAEIPVLLYPLSYPTGVYLWKLLDGKHTFDALNKKLRTHAEGVPEEAREHIRAFIDELVREGLAGFDLASVGLVVTLRKPADSATLHTPEYSCVLSGQVSEVNPCTYGPPKVVDLSGRGPAARGDCVSGSGDSGPCNVGGGAGNNCWKGNSPSFQCLDRNSASGYSCCTGTGPSWASNCHPGSCAHRDASCAPGGTICSFGSSAGGTPCSAGT